MEKAKFSAILPLISSDLVEMIAMKRRMTEHEAIIKLYTSKLYALLEKEDTKIWQYSTPMLYVLWEQEEKSGNISFPDV